MAEAAKPVYLVDPEADPVVVRIEGRACFQNSPCLREFISEMLRRGRSRFLIDFSGCASMDSTFLGVVAGVALELRRASPPGHLVACRVGERNLELMRSLGLHRLLEINAADGTSAPCPQALESRSTGSEAENARHVLEAHENLVSADEENRRRFQDVLTFLRLRVERS